MTFFTPGKPYLDTDPQPPLSPLVMNNNNSNNSTVLGNSNGYMGGTALRRFPSNASSGSGSAAAGSNNKNRNRNPPENSPSRLLSLQENSLLFDVLGKGRQTLSSAVVQLLFPTPDNDWRLRDVGVLCFVRDSSRRSYFLEIISLRMMRVIFSQEIYEEFVYRQPNNRMRFLTFEGDEFTVGLSFASIDEMREFRTTLDNKMAAKRKRQIERQRSMYDQASSTAAIYGGGSGGSSIRPNSGPPAVKSPTITSASMHSMLSGLAAPISPYATARPAPNINSPTSPTTNKFNTVSGSSPMAKTMAASHGGGGPVSSFGTMRSNQSPYAVSMNQSMNGRPNGGIGKASVPMTPISIPKIHTSQVTAGPGTEASQPIVSSITLSQPPGAGKKLNRFGRKDSTASSNYSNNIRLQVGKKDGKEVKIFKDKGKKDKSNNKKEKLSKADIGLPTNFVHVQHAGFDSKNKFTNDVLNERYKALFDKIGISSKELQDDRTRTFIYDFIDQYEQDHTSSARPPPTSQQAQAQQSQPPNAGFNQQQGSMSNAGRTNVLPAPASIQPPPIPARVLDKKQAPAPPTPPQQNQQHQARYNGQQSTATAVASVPPPPPLPAVNNGGHGHHPQQQSTRQIQRQGSSGAGSFPPPPPPLPMQQSQNQNGEEPVGIQKAPSTPEVGGRVNLLKEIQAGIALRKVEPGEKVPDSDNSVGGSMATSESIDGLAGALARALAERSRVIHSDSSSSDEDDGDGDDSDEWK